MLQLDAVHGSFQVAFLEQLLLRFLQERQCISLACDSRRLPGFQRQLGTCYYGSSLDEQR